MVIALFIIRGRARRHLCRPRGLPGAPTVWGARRLLQVDGSEFIAQNEVIFAFSKIKVAFTQYHESGPTGGASTPYRRDEQSEALMTRIETDERTPVKVPARDIDDRAKVRMGSMSPSFPAAKPAAEHFADAGRIEMGSISPAFPPVRTA
jgi:hypothetical protein